MSRTTRRGFLRTGFAAGVGTAFAGPARATGAWRRFPTASPTLARPVVVASGNGEPAVTRALAILNEGRDPLDAVIEGVNLVEADPEDYTVGYGGLPNALGVVQLDSSCMHGPTHRAGGVAALEGIKHPSRVARIVMEETDHVLLVGAGAKRFALEHGFEEEELLTETARQVWLYWRGTLGDEDDYLPPKPAGSRRSRGRSSSGIRTSSARRSGALPERSTAAPWTPTATSLASRPRAGSSSRFPAASVTPRSSEQGSTSTTTSGQRAPRAAGKRTS